MKKLLAVCLGLLLAAATVQAAQPSQMKWSYDATRYTSCGAFDVVFESEVSNHITYFFTNDGTLRDARLHVQADMEIYREGYPDNVLMGRRNNIQHADFEDGNLTTLEVTGIVIQVMLPGYGHLYFDTGHTYLDFVDGSFNVTLLRGANHDEWLGQTEALCAYFA